jgi:anti-sigma regulatory factor (Ser/Thr protein kinase)/CHASE3 domain sensor protein
VRPRFGVRQQILLLSAVPVLFLIPIFIIVMSLEHLADAGAAAARAGADETYQAERIYSLINLVNHVAQSYSRTNDPKALRGYDDIKAQLPPRYASLMDAAGSEPEDVAVAERYVGSVKEIFVAADRYIDLLREGRGAAAQTWVTSPAVQKVGKQIMDAKAEIDSRQRDRATRELMVLHEKRRRLFTTLVALTALGIVTSLVLGGVFGVRIVRRLRALVVNAQRLARREDTPPIGGEDEITEVDRATHELAERLNESLALQLALVPERLPSVAGLRLDAVYVPAAVHSKVGGDWFDVFEISDYVVGLSIGDVAGHGLNAASTMASLREAIRIATRIEGSPSVALNRVNRSIMLDHPGELATATLGIFDSRTGTYRWSVAGHPPAMLVRPDEGLTMLDGKGLVLGVDEQYEYAEYDMQLDAGSGLLYYTDGVVEIDRDYFQGVRNLQAALLASYEVSSSGGNVAADIKRRVFGERLPSDDAAILFVGIESAGAPMFGRRRAWDLDAGDPLSARRVKRAVLWTLAGSSASEADHTALEIVLGELLANVARHTPGAATVILEERDGNAILSFEDRGPPFTIRTNGTVPDVLSEHGRGFWLISQFASSTRVERTCEGNRVIVAVPLSATAQAQR